MIAVTSEKCSHDHVCPDRIPEEVEEEKQVRK